MLNSEAISGWSRRKALQRQALAPALRRPDNMINFRPYPPMRGHATLTPITYSLSKAVGEEAQAALWSGLPELIRKYGTPFA
jgi:hypothetical protein